MIFLKEKIMKNPKFAGESAILFFWKFSEKKFSEKIQKKPKNPTHPQKRQKAVERRPFCPEGALPQSGPLFLRKFLKNACQSAIADWQANLVKIH